MNVLVSAAQKDDGKTKSGNGGTAKKTDGSEEEATFSSIVLVTCHRRRFNIRSARLS